MVNQEISVILVDDHILILEGLEHLLNQTIGIKVVNKFTSAELACEYVENNIVDIVITDLDMPEMNGIDMIKRVRKRKPDQKIIVLSMMSTHSIINRMIRYNVNGYLLKNEAQNELKTALQAVMNGQTYFNKEVKDAIFKEPNTKRQTSPKRFFPKLSKREVEVLDLIAKENTTSEISKLLFISEGTVITHRKHILAKLDVKNTAGIVRRAFELGYIS